MVQAYAVALTDGAEHFADVFERFLAMITTEPTLTTLDELATITALTLVMAGDDDMVCF